MLINQYKLSLLFVNIMKNNSIHYFSYFVISKSPVRISSQDAMRNAHNKPNPTVITDVHIVGVKSNTNVVIVIFGYREKSLG